jgi:hypothetical protein
MNKPLILVSRTILKLICGQQKRIKKYHVSLLLNCMFCFLEFVIFKTNFCFASKINSTINQLSNQKSRIRRNSRISKAKVTLIIIHILAFTFSRSISQSFLILSHFVSIFLQFILNSCFCVFRTNFYNF